MKAEHKNNFVDICKGRGRALLKPAQQGKSLSKIQKQKAIKNVKEMSLGKDYKRTIIQVPHCCLEQEINIYQWRAKTNHPLLFSTWIGVQFQNPQSFIRNKDLILTQIQTKDKDIKDMITLHVKTQSSDPLQKYTPLPLSQHLYSLKEAIYGFEQLHSRFGIFCIDPTCIRVNSQMKIKVWHSNPLHINPPSHKQNLQQTQQILIRQIIAIFNGYRQNTMAFRQFYEGANIHSSFLQLIKYIDTFVDKHKIKIAKRIIAKTSIDPNRAQSPKNINRRVPKFLSPSTPQYQLNSASARFSAEMFMRRKPQNSLSPSKNSKQESISLKKTAQTKATDHKINLVRTQKHRKGSGNHFCFTSLHRLQAACENLKSKSKASEICLGRDQNGQSQTMFSINAENSLLRNFDKLFEQKSQIDYLSVSINLEQEQPMAKKAVKLKKLSNYGRTVNESIINSRQALMKRQCLDNVFIILINYKQIQNNFNYQLFAQDIHFIRKFYTHKQLVI